MKKKDIFDKTKRKIILFCTLIVFLCLFMFSIVVSYLYKARLFASLDRELVKQEILNKQITSKFNDSIVKDKLLLKPPPLPHNITIIVYIDDKLEFISPNAYFNKDNIENMDMEISEGIENFSFNDYNFREHNFEYGNQKIFIFANIDSELQSVSNLSKSIFISLIILSFITLLLAIILSRKVIEPIKNAYDKQVFFIQDASHEMRTPLAVIKGKLELLVNKRKLTIEENFEDISKIMSEVRGLEKLNSDLLLLTKEDMNQNIKLEYIDLDIFIEDIGEFYYDLADIQDKKFEIINNTSNIVVKWDYDKIKRTIIILIENAFKYTPSGGEISLIFEEKNKDIYIKVVDTGIGIKKEDQKRIFDRFFRVTDKKNAGISGSGIGLSLLKSISKTLGFTINFSSEVDKGTEFELIIPRKIRIK